MKEPRIAAFPVEVMCPVRLALVVTLPAVNPDAVPVMLVPTSADGVPRAGVTSVGEVPKTNAPVPVSSLITPSNCADDVAENCESGLATRASPLPDGVTISKTPVVELYCGTFPLSAELSTPTVDIVLSIAMLF